MWRRGTHASDSPAPCARLGLRFSGFRRSDMNAPFSRWQASSTGGLAPTGPGRSAVFMTIFESGMASVSSVHCMTVMATGSEMETVYPVKVLQSCFEPLAVCAPPTEVPPDSRSSEGVSNFAQLASAGCPDFTGLHEYRRGAANGAHRRRGGRGLA